MAAVHKDLSRVSLRRPGTNGTLHDMALARDELARRLRAAKERSGLTLDQIGERIPNKNGEPTSWRVAQRWFAGRSTPPPSKLNQIADVLGVDPELFQEPQQEHVYDRLGRKADENAATLRTALGLLDDLARKADAIQAAIDRLQTETAGRYDVLTARLDATETALTQVQRDFLQALGAPAPPPAADAPGQAKSKRSKKNPGTGREAG